MVHDTFPKMFQHEQKNSKLIKNGFFYYPVLKNNGDRNCCIRYTHTTILHKYTFLKMAYHDGAVLRAAGDHLIVVRTPVDVQHWSCVSTYRRVGLIYTTRLQRKETRD